jgi:hypothetical protein
LTQANHPDTIDLTSFGLSSTDDLTFTLVDLDGDKTFESTKISIDGIGGWSVTVVGVADIDAHHWTGIIELEPSNSVVIFLSFPFWGNGETGGFWPPVLHFEAWLSFSFTVYERRLRTPMRRGRQSRRKMREWASTKISFREFHPHPFNPRDNACDCVQHKEGR